MNFWQFFIILQGFSIVFQLLYKALWPFHSLRSFLINVKKPGNYLRTFSRGILMKLLRYDLSKYDLQIGTGQIKIRKTYHNQIIGSFLKILYIILAPVLLCTIGIIEIFENWHTFDSSLLVKITRLILLIILFLGVRIEKKDLKEIADAFRERPVTNLRQIIEIVLVIVGVLLIFPILNEYENWLILGYLTDFFLISIGLFIVEFLIMIIKMVGKIVHKKFVSEPTITKRNIPNFTEKNQRRHKREFYSKIIPIDLAEDN